eukprot:12198602-Ditylum_brightwellii.AAC.1
MSLRLEPVRGGAKKRSLSKDDLRGKVVSQNIANDMVSDVKTNVIWADNESGIHISNDVAFSAGGLEMTSKDIMYAKITVTMCCCKENVICR